ncbi:DUF4893 domain-containing protein [Sphingomonas immobilis]|uniref:DUF4893 domain-containing protein n=1 Tax=Sphingomonas immobilis TaxID=3063997 RepID=A0ABT9A1Z0_9SPHN|nr:DUF4893 domain-containing protein [Sphingomonas sp. CA1-15]MDO7843275.1 DUF4893 domain-containing protein [Sphingomonas sp. CA1-15]
MALALILLSALAACTAGGGHPKSAAASAVVEVAPVPAWKAVATDVDLARIGALPGVWTHAIAGLKKGARATLATEGALLDPAAAKDLPALPPGPYRCRLLRFDARGGLIGFKPDFCVVTGDAKGIALTKQTGSNLPGGWLHPDGDHRLIFLGAQRAAAADTPPAYGTDAAADLAGVIERVDAFRWRLTLARAGKGALLDVYELVPVTPEVPGATRAVPAPTPVAAKG